MKAVRNAVLGAVTLTVVLAARADTPAGGPATRVEHVSQKTGLRAFSGGHTTDLETVRVTLIMPVDDYTLSDLNGYLEGIQATQNDAAYGFRTGNLNTDNQINLMSRVRWNANTEDMPQTNKSELAVALSADLKLDPALPAEKRKARIEQTQAALYDVLAARDFLQTLVDNKPGPDQRSLTERLTNWQMAAVSFNEQIRTKRSRLDALQRQRQQLAARRDAALDNDPVAGGLKKIAELREQKVKLVEEQAQAGHATPQEVLDAKLAVAEAELKLAERRASAAPPATVASLNQIEAEITKVSVDLDELGSGLREVENNLAPYNVSNATTQSLTKMARAVNASEDETKALKMLVDLKQQAEALRTDLLRLKIVKIEAAD